MLRLSILAIFLIPASLCGAAETAESSIAPQWDVQSDTWAATDALGRKLPDASECGPLRPGKYVGIFYFLWLGAHGHDLYDNSKLIAANPEKPAFGPPGMFHWWGEPLFGYYRSIVIQLSATPAERDWTILSNCLVTGTLILAILACTLVVMGYSARKILLHTPVPGAAPQVDALPGNIDVSD